LTDADAVIDFLHMGALYLDRSGVRVAAKDGAAGKEASKVEMDAAHLRGRRGR
jgi:hypothetical protein